MQPFQVILSLVGIVVIIFACYYVTFYIGVKASGQSRGGLRNKNISLIDRFAVSRDKSFCIVEVAGKVYLIGITNQSMTLLDTLDAAAFAETGTQHNDQPAWNMMPGSCFTGRMTKKLAAFIAQKMGRTIDFSEDKSETTFADNMKTAREKERDRG